MGYVTILVRSFWVVIGELLICARFIRAVLIPLALIQMALVHGHGDWWEAHVSARVGFSTVTDILSKPTIGYVILHSTTGYGHFHEPIESIVSS